MLRLMLQSRSLDVRGDHNTLVRRLQSTLEDGNPSATSSPGLQGSTGSIQRLPQPDFSPSQMETLAKLIQDGVLAALETQRLGNPASSPQAAQLQEISEAAKQASENAQLAVDKANQALAVAGTSGTSRPTPGTSPTLAQVAAATKQKILAGEYIDFSVLLPDQIDFEASTDFTLQCDTSNTTSPLRITTKPKTRKITSIEQWLSAFSTYMHVVVSGFPHRALELLKYQDTIRLAAQKFKGMAWFVYDQTFRRRAAIDPSITWDRVDLELWTVTFVGNARPHCPVCASINHTANFCPLRDTSRSQRPDRRRTYCYEFNKRTGCSRSNCSFPHCCSTCGEAHSAVSCTANKDTTTKKSR